MRVLQFGRNWNVRQGSVENQVALLSRELVAQGGIDVVNLVAAPGLHSSDTVVDGFRLVQVSSLGRIFGITVAPLLLFKAIALHREKKFDVLHIHLPDPLSHLASLMLPSSIKRVITWHSDIFRKKLWLRLYLPFLTRLVRRADAVVTTTAARYTSSTQIPLSTAAHHHHVIAYGLDRRTLELTTNARSLSVRIKAKAAGRSVIFAMGQHTKDKGFDTLINAMREVDAMLVLGGDGRLRDELEAMAGKAKVEEKVWFSGYISNENLPAYFDACDVFCVPSTAQTDATGISQIKAIACGKPVVSPVMKNGINVDGKTGLVVTKQDSGSLAAAINRLITDRSLRDRMGLQSKQRAISEYSLDQMTRAHLSLYQGLLTTAR